MATSFLRSSIPERRSPSLWLGARSPTSSNRTLGRLAKGAARSRTELAKTSLDSFRKAFGSPMVAFGAAFRSMYGSTVSTGRDASCCHSSRDGVQRRDHDLLIRLEHALRFPSGELPQRPSYQRLGTMWTSGGARCDDRSDHHVCATDQEIGLCNRAPDRNVGSDTGWSEERPPEQKGQAGRNCSPSMTALACVLWIAARDSTLAPTIMAIQRTVTSAAKARSVATSRLTDLHNCPHASLSNNANRGQGNRNGHQGDCDDEPQIPR